MGAEVMSAIISRFADYANRRAPETDEGFVRRRVCEMLKGRVTNMRLAQAQARAERLVAGRVTTRTNAIQRTVAWAVSADQSNPPPQNAA
jgi:hypothetical protein